MGKSWGYKLNRLTNEELKKLEDQDTWWERHRKNISESEKTVRETRNIMIGYNSRCKMGRCKERAVYCLQYNYVTGRAGRISWARKNICEKHAQKYLKYLQEGEKK